MNYSDHNYWNNWYAEQKELLRARQELDDVPADQAGFEQQLNHLQLSSSEEGSSDELSSPDNQRAMDGLGGSMRVPPQDNRFSSTRHSVDIPRAHFGAAMQGSPSDLRNQAPSSMRDTAPSEPKPAARTKDRKGGLLSRFKSGLGKVFGESRAEKSLGGSASDAVDSELRIYAYKRTRTSEDAALISEFVRGAAGSYASGTLNMMGEQLSQFSEFLNSKDLTLAGLVESPAQLKAQADEFVNRGGVKRVRAALEALRKFRAGELLPRPPARTRRPQPPAHTGDALLIHQFAAAARAHGVPDKTFRSHTEVLNNFSKWLTANQKPSLTSRFRTEEIADDIMAFAEENDPNGRLFTALNHLRRIQPDGAGFEALGSGPRFMGRRTLSAYENDADIIDEATNEALRKLGPAATAKERAPILKMASNQRRLSEWLKREGKESIATGLNGNEQQKNQLQKDISEFKRAIGNPNIGLAINKLRHPQGDELQHGLAQHVQVVEANRALGVAFPDQPSREPQLPGASLSWSPRVPSDFDPREWPTPERAPARSSDIYRGLASFTDLPSTPQEMREDAQSRPVLSPASRPPFFTGPSGMPPDGAGFEALGSRPRVMGRRTLSAYENDADIIDEATNEALRKLGPAATAKERAPILKIASNQRKLSEWLKREGKESIATGLNGNEQQKKQLQKDISEFKRAIGNPNIGLAINKLRHHLQGDELQPGLQPYDDDANIIGGLVKEELSKLGSGRTPKTVRNAASGQRKFSDWLRTMGRESIASRINGDWHQRDSLDRDYQEFTKAKGNLGIGLKRLAQYVQVVEANRALGVAFPDQPTPERAPARSSDIYRGLASFTDLPSTPQEMREDAQSRPVLSPAGRPPFFTGPSGMPQELEDVGRQHGSDLQEPAGSSSTWSLRVPSDFDPREWPTPERAPARSSDIYRGLASFTDLPSTPQEMREDAQSKPVLSPAGRPPFFSGPSGMPQELEDIGHLVGEDWQHGSQPVPDFLLDVLDNKMLLPSLRMVPQPVSINGETYSIALGPRGRRDAQLIHHPGPSSDPDTQIGASTASASAGDRSGRLLGAREWVSDDNIQRDYELLAQEFQQSNPNLAARTRFVDPLMAFQVAQGTDVDALRAFHRIVDDRNGNDTAEFLFLPVNGANHWSLLLIDRRARERPVAYHYDSFSPLHHTIATEFAERLGASSLQPMGMAQQRNSFDCGVFVLDATRELARRLAQEPRPRRQSLHLDNLVADRRALQDRLMAQPPARDQSAGPSRTR
ncbi:hypothetical protein GCM10007880_67790 [Mesorhizobium amorphae]|uniref:Ulp1 family isopeptidase n=1 Tax=Mesorhizobium amorphae TaxID=71433 RepID=UPI00235C338A|nr:Ulp1 family isopeptidase [Mesorhizobium amorphae]GLR46261.1 hypothetical protein GCM10007880_67790 [Mesorhizobium amorphae]